MSQNTRRDPRAKVLSMTVRYRSATLGEFIEHHSYDVSRGGMFIKTPSPFPPGTLLKFEVKIAGEQRVMQGVGRVVWKRDRPSEETGEPAGMGIKFIKIDDSSKSVIEKLVEARGPGSGAFEASPDSAVSKANMFPASKADSPAPEDRTVMKPAAELLNEALSKTGQSPLGADSTLGSAQMPEGVPASEKAPTTVTPPNSSFSGGAPSAAAPATLRQSQTEGPEKKAGSKEERASTATEATRPRAASAGGGRAKEEEGSGGRALALLVVAGLVMAGIFLLTKKSSEPLAEEPGERESPSLPTPSAVLAPEPAPTTSPVESVLVEDGSGPALSAGATEGAPQSSATEPPGTAPVGTAPAPATSAAPPSPPASASAPAVPKPAPRPKPKPKPVAAPTAPVDGPPVETPAPAPAVPSDPESN